MTITDAVRLGPGVKFQRPQHGNPYVFQQGYLWEVLNNNVNFPRLTVDDILATDWERLG